MQVVNSQVRESGQATVLVRVPKVLLTGDFWIRVEHLTSLRDVKVVTDVLVQWDGKR